MKLYAQLQVAKTEEDVKDAYIRALRLKVYSKGLIDIRTDEIWFEAKDTGKNSCYAMFTQLLHYVQDALNKGEPVPPLLAVIDTEKAALMKSADVLPFLTKKTIKWGKSASQYTQQALDEISSFFDGLKGDFPIGFLIWKTDQQATIKNPISEIITDVLDKRGHAIGSKSFFNLPNSVMLTNWMGRYKPNEIEVLPLINAVTPTTKTKGVRRTKWSSGAVAHMLSDSNDLQRAGRAQQKRRHRADQLLTAGRRLCSADRKTEASGVQFGVFTIVLRLLRCARNNKLAMTKVKPSTRFVRAACRTALANSRRYQTKGSALGRPGRLGGWPTKRCNG